MQKHTTEQDTGTQTESERRAVAWRLGPDIFLWIVALAGVGVLCTLFS